jgi:RimJ/RimL family protein N-acetyltransferase
LLLRNVEDNDAAIFSKLLSDPRNTSMDPHGPSTIDVELSKKIITRMRESAAVPTVLDGQGRAVSGPGRVNLVVVRMMSDEEGAASGGEVIGISGFGDIKDLDNPAKDEEGQKEKLRVGDVGVLLDTDSRGKGFAAEAIRLSVEWGFAKAQDGGLQLDKITLGTAIENAPMIGLIEKKFGWTGIERPNPMNTEKTEKFYEILPFDFKTK